MTTENPYAQYNKSKVLTASPAELTLMLYDGAIKFGNIAVLAMEKKEIEKAHNNIMKMTRIIEELRLSLDMKYPVAQDFDRIYAYVLQRLLECNVSKDPEIMEEILKHIRSLRDTWKEVMKAAGQNKQIV